MHIENSCIPDKGNPRFSLGIQCLISPMLSHPGIVQVKFMRNLRPFLETSKFQHTVVSFKSVSFSLNCPETSEYQSGRLKSSNQRNLNAFLFMDAAGNDVEPTLC